MGEDGRGLPTVSQQIQLQRLGRLEVERAVSYFLLDVTFCFRSAKKSNA